MFLRCRFAARLECRTDRFALLPCHERGPAGRRSRPTSTRSVFDRSPMIFFMGSGSRRTSVGIARI